MATAQKTSVDALRRELDLRFEEECHLRVQGASDILSELVLTPVEESVPFPLFYQQVLNQRTGHGHRTARRVPSRPSEGAEPSDVLPYPTDTSRGDLFPPLTNRGVTKHETICSENQYFQSPQFQSIETSQNKILGGYDGGVEVGFNGHWSDLKFKTILQTLETAKNAAENEGGDERFVELGGKTFSVYAHGANCGAHYKYVIEGSGIKIYIHANPKGPIQPVRLRYGFEALCGRDLFAVHADILEWFQEIGFYVEGEIVSRADFQVMSHRPMAEFMQLIFSNRSVQRAKTANTRTQGGKFETFTLGTAIQLCIYDKRKELIDTCDEVKMSLLVNDCLGGEFPDDLTRIEFRMRRDALRVFNINTIQDLLERENAMVDYLTNDWFRLIKEEKQKGHTAEQDFDPIWQEVRNLFFEYFPGPIENRKPVERKDSRRAIKCTGESLIKQAVGCLATAAALAKGVFETGEQALNFVREVVTEKVQTLVTRVRERVVELGIVRGVEVPDAVDWHLDPRYACGSSDEVYREFRVVYDEDVQYENFRNYAVAGCPF